MNPYRFTGPDTPIGRLLLVARAEIQFLVFRLGKQGEYDADFVRLARDLIPAHTMVSVHRLRQLHALGQKLGQSDTPGAVVECGVWNGGSSAIVAAGVGRGGDTKRPFWLFDSFAGLPEPTDKDDIKVRRGYFPGWCTGAVERVREAHRLAGHDLAPEAIVPGWFEDTLPGHAAAIGPIALLHVDADWYNSVMTVFQTLYDQVVPGGVVVIDDYGVWSGCRDAVHDFFGKAGMAQLRLRPIDGNAVWFYKP